MFILHNNKGYIEYLIDGQLWTRRLDGEEDFWNDPRYFLISDEELCVSDTEPSDQQRLPYLYWVIHN